MHLIESLILISLLAVLFVQDWKSRLIHVSLPIGIFVISLCLNTGTAAAKATLVFGNLVFFLLTLSLLVAYMSLKNRKFLNPFKNYFGVGDLLFFMAVTPLFLMRHYVIYFVLSMVLSIVLQASLKKRVEKDSVPLAGFASLLLIALLANDLFFSFNKITIV